MGKKESAVCIRRNLGHESDRQETLCWGFADGDSLPRDSFIPKQGSDERK